jgi:hypothetical protein
VLIYKPILGLALEILLFKTPFLGDYISTTYITFNSKADSGLLSIGNVISGSSIISV